MVCGDCRGKRQCAVCHFERLDGERRAQRRARLQELGRRAAVIALVAASGATGLGAAFLPDGPLCTSVYAAPTTVELRLLPEDDAGELVEPTTLEPARLQWTQTLTFRCFAVGDSITCCVVGPR
ncbi:MAG: hypothetical protein JWN44_6591 [Myxococcales bacterium]|nr:hypothetical protein [Myxococcales bacterium]